jgi:hypothetical protein
MKLWNRKQLFAVHTKIMYRQILMSYLVQLIWLPPWLYFIPSGVIDLALAVD